jgi:subfamily B ATP-binding cassette protein MsbA
MTQTQMMDSSPQKSPEAKAPPEEKQFATDSSVAFYQSLVARYWRLFVGMMVLMAIYAGITASRILAGGVLIDAVSVHFGRAPERFVKFVDTAWRSLFGIEVKSVSERLPDNDFFVLFASFMTIVFLVAAVAMALVYYFKEYFANSLIVRMTVDIRKALFNHLTRQSVAYFNRQRSGDVISRVTNDVNTVQLSFRFFFEDIVQEPLTILAALIVALVASPYLFALTVPFYGILMLPVLRSGKKVIKHGRGRLEKMSLVTEAIQQLFSGIRIVKSFGMERFEQRSFKERNKQFIRSTMKMNRAKLKGRAFQELLYNFGTALIMLLGAVAIAWQWIDVPNFMVFMAAMVQIYNPLKSLSRAWNQIQESRAGVDRVLEVLREKPMIQDHHGSLEFPGVKGEIRFENISFSYSDIKASPLYRNAAAEGENGGGTPHLPVLHEISFEAKAGEVVALVGPSGAGKSTIVDLLSRFYDPQNGRVLIDGRDIRDYRLASYLRAIAIVSQDPFLFNSTIRENIRYGKETATDEEIEEAARIAFAHEFILEQPEGYDTVIGERGVKLSGGQRQRITIARAILKNAPILILDEATSSLDSQSEKEVQNAIDNLIRARTTFVIAHRLSTIAHADRILVIEEGRIVERGCHEELLSRRGRYHILWRSQNPDGGSAVA